MTRREAREFAFAVVFEKEMNDSPLEELIELAVQSEEFEADDYVIDSTKGVFAHLSEIDGLISENSNGWSISRISKTALAALRLCIYEMLYVDSIPVSVSINEAVEITKKYATKEDASFVNGILSTVEKKRKND